MRASRRRARFYFLAAALALGAAFFLGAAFLAAGFLAAGFLAAGFVAAAGFLALGLAGDLALKR